MTQPYLSFSRLSRWEQCPLSFRLHYVDQHQAAPGVPLLFGAAVHTAIERISREIFAEDLVVRGPAMTQAQQIWAEEYGASGIHGLALYREGLALVRQAVQRLYEKCPEIIGIEQRFEIPVAGRTILGFIDRADRVDDETVEVIDYKTNRMLYTREEVDSSLQLGIYALAAQQLWPWAQKVRLTIDMLRHGLRMRTERSAEDLVAVEEYVGILAQQIETATEYPARLNANCVWCDHCAHCTAYVDALAGRDVRIAQSEEDLAEVSAEREDLVHRQKIMRARVADLDAILKAALEGREEVQCVGATYRMYTTETRRYPVRETVDMICRVSRADATEILKKIARVENKALDGALQDLGLTRSVQLLLRAELEGLAAVSRSQRLWAKKEKMS